MITQSDQQHSVDRYRESARIFEHNRKYIPGGVISVNRATQPEIAFVKGCGAYLWDADGNRYTDYHAAFAPCFLGHNDSYVNEAVTRVMRDGLSLFGSGTTLLEGKLAELICHHIPWVESVQFLNTGSEATSLAVRLSRAVTGRDHVIVVQGGYNGNHDELACNVFNSIEEIGPRVSPGEYPLRPLGGGTTLEQTHFVHAINFNTRRAAETATERNRRIARFRGIEILAVLNLHARLKLGQIKEVAAVYRQVLNLVLRDDALHGRLLGVHRNCAGLNLNHLTGLANL